MSVLLLFTAALAAPTLPGFGNSADPDWRVVGIYDAAAVGLLSRTAEAAAEGGVVVPPNYVWQATDGMNAACGPGKAPVGLGVFEAAAMVSGLTPTLAVVLERTGPAQPALTVADLRVSVAGGQNLVLRPAVLPRSVAVSIEGGPLALRQLIRTQLEMRLCMEHKVGRQWRGGKENDVREAFLLKSPSAGPSDERRYFGGQKEPEAALLGPPDACLVRGEGFAEKGEGGGRGAGALNLVPSDVWGSSLRWCTERERQGADARATAADAALLQLSNPDGTTAAARRSVWHELSVNVDDGGGNVDDATVDVRWDGASLIPDGARAPLFPRKKGTIEGITDVLALAPYTYPTVGPPDDPERYTVLLIPNWQIAEAARGIAEGDGVTSASAGAGPTDAVGWLLERPSLLRVQLGRNLEEPRPGAKPEWPDLASGLASPYSPRNWGYAVGLAAGRAPIVLPGPDVPGWEAEAAAQRAKAHAAFLAAAAALVVILVAGIVRLRELWTRVPEERAAYWPGEPAAKDELPDDAEIPAPGGGAG